MASPPPRSTTRAPDGSATLFALQLLELDHGRICVIDHFMTAGAHAAFLATGLPRTLPAPHA